MLELSFIRADKERVIQGLKTRNFKDENLKVVDEVLALDEVRRKTQTELDNNLAESRQLSDQIGLLYKQGKREEADVLKGRVAELKEVNKDLEQTMADAMARIEELLLGIPNIPHASVPQ